MRLSLILFTVILSGASVPGAYAQTDAEIVFFIASKSIAVVTTDNNKLGSAVAYYPLNNGWTGLLTNCHTLRGATSLRVSQKGKSVEAMFLAGDPDADICLIAARMELPVPDTRNFFDLRVGEAVFAIGSPKGLELSISNGIISQLRGTIFESLLIQTTAPISPGSSGGGLFDARGRLVGLTTFYLDQAQGLNFAVSVNMANSLSRSAKARKLSDLADSAK
jgi:S1-C subfamily serine protease